MSLDAGQISYSVNMETAALTRGERIANRSTRNVERDFDRVDRKSQQLNVTMTRLAKAIGSVFAARQIQRFVIGTAQAIDEQNKFAQQVGVSFEQLQRLQFVATQTGASVGTMNNSLRRGSRRIADAARDGGAAADSLERMGISARDLVRENPAEQFRQISDAIRQLPESEQGAAANAIFGRDGEFLLNALRLGRSGIDDLANSLDGVISDKAARDAANFNDELDRLSRAAGVAGGQIAGQMLPALTGMINTITEVVNNAELMENIINGVGVAAMATGAILAGRFTASLVTSIAAMRSATVAAGALRGALAFLGGPVGIAVIAGLAITEFIRRTSETAQIRRAKEEIDKLSESFDLLTEAQQKNRLETLRAQRLEIVESLEKEARALAENRKEKEEMPRNARTMRGELVILNNEIAQGEQRVRVLTSSLFTASTAMQEMESTMAAAGDQTEDAFGKIGDSAARALSPVEAVLAEIERARELMEFGISADEDPFDAGGQSSTQTADPGDIGLTRLQALERQFEQEQQILLDAQEAKIESEVAYEERLSELRRQYAAQRQEILDQEKTGFIAALEQMGLSFATLENQAVGTITNMATGLQSSSDAARDLGRAIITQIVGALVKTAAAKAAETAMGVGQAATLAAAYQPAAIAASIATGGAAATSGAAAVIGATNTMTAALNMGAGRLNGGPVQPGMIHPVTEDGKPEMLVQGPDRYLLTGSRGGEVISNPDMQSGAGDTINLGGLNLTVHGDVNRRQIEDVVFDLEPRIYQMIESGKARRGQRF